MTDTLAILAASWGVAMALSPILQIRRIVERRSSADLSLTYQAVLQVGFTLWVAYGISLQNAAIYVPNSVAFSVGLVTIVLAARFRRGDPQPAGG
jgi:MtN3 and saliva related transmembrane protein